MTPWEMAERPDADYWVAEALILRNAEIEGQAIAHDIENKRNGNAKK